MQTRHLSYASFELAQRERETCAANDAEKTPRAISSPSIEESSSARAEISLTKPSRFRGTVIGKSEYRRRAAKGCASGPGRILNLYGRLQKEPLFLKSSE